MLFVGAPYLISDRIGAVAIGSFVYLFYGVLFVLLCFTWKSSGAAWVILLLHHTSIVSGLLVLRLCFGWSIETALERLAIVVHVLGVPLWTAWGGILSIMGVLIAVATNARQYGLGTLFWLTASIGVLFGGPLLITTGRPDWQVVTVFAMTSLPVLGQLLSPSSVARHGARGMCGLIVCILVIVCFGMIVTYGVIQRLVVGPGNVAGLGGPLIATLSMLLPCVIIAAPTETRARVTCVAALLLFLAGMWLIWTASY
jgi:hypothetical protein